MIVLTVLAGWLVIGGLLIIPFFWEGMTRTWREPVLRRPVLIVESDDWGPGPLEQATALKRIADILSGFADCDDRRPVMTLGMVLAAADGKKILSSGSYQRRKISAHTHGTLLNAISSGFESHVFSIQLHGMEHFWPPALVSASKTDKAVRAWLDGGTEAVTEDLPAPLQSRWVDGSILPAGRLDPQAVQQAVQEEVDAFEDIFGSLPSVVVPPTFIWNEDVESAWAKAGVAVVVTPGRRFETRDGEGNPAASGTIIYNGQTTENDLVYLVRDVYFEPALGHTAIEAVEALLFKTRLGRPTLLETHRFNFLGTEENNRLALTELERLLQMAVGKCPHLAFLSSSELAVILKSGDPRWLEVRFSRKLHMWIMRLGELPRLRKLAWVTGWIVPAGLLWRLTAWI
jgi:hypothetical protein